MLTGEGIASHLTPSQTLGLEQSIGRGTNSVSRPSCRSSALAMLQYTMWKNALSAASPLK